MRFIAVTGIFIATDVRGLIPIKSAQWPKPVSGYLQPLTSGGFCVKDAFSLQATSSTPVCSAAQPLQTALSQMNAMLTGVACPDTTAIPIDSKIQYEFKTCEDFIKPNLDESYTLDIDTAGQIVIKGTNQFGVRHGLTTLGNLLEARNLNYTSIMPENYKYFYHKTTSSMVLPYQSVSINDRPRLPHRGLMIDTARTFLSVDTIKRTIVAMGMVKLNVLHWHLSDDQSFPALFDEATGSLMESIQGADCGLDNTTSCLALMEPEAYYTDAQLVDIVNFAESHGVRVLFEIDQPAHAASWASGDRSFLYFRGQTTREAFYETWGVLDIYRQSEAIWTKYGQPILKQISAISRPGEYIHFGADEFPPGVFGENVNETLYVNSWLEKVINLITAEERLPVAWQDGLKSAAGSANKQVVAQIWDDASRAVEIANKGHDIIWSPATIMYLDCGRGNTVIPDLKSWCAPYTTWYQIYLQTPDILVEQDPKYSSGSGKVLGGEVCLWNDARNSYEQDTGLWPRAAAWAGAAWEQRDSIPVSAMDAEDENTLVEGVLHAVTAQRQLSGVATKIRNFAAMPVAAYFQDYCLFHSSSLCDSYIAVWYKENYMQRKASGSLRSFALVAMPLVALVIF